MRLVLISLALGPLPDHWSPSLPQATPAREEALALAWCELAEIAETAWAAGDELTARAAREVQDRVSCAVDPLVVRRYIPAYHAGQRLYRSTGAAPRPAV